MGHNPSPQDAAHLSKAMDEDNIQDAAALNEAMDEDKDDIYLADADSEGSTVKMGSVTSHVENNDPMTLSDDSVDSTVDLDGEGFFLGNEARTVFYGDHGFLLSSSAHRRSRRPPPRRTAEQHSPPNIPHSRSFSSQQNSAVSGPANNGSNTLSSAAQADDLANRLEDNRLSFGINNGLPTVLTNRESSQPVDQLGEQLNDLSINHPSENESSNESHKAPSHSASDSGFDEYGMELIRWFKPSQIQGISPDQLLVYNTRKQFSHVRKLKPHNFPFLHAGDTWVDEGTIVISIAAHDRGENHLPVAWSVHFGHESKFNVWRPVRNIHTVIIRNSSPWLTRAMTGGLELYNYGYHLPWLDGHQLLYLQDLRNLVNVMQSMTDHGTNPLKFRFWCVEPEANREAIELALRVYAGSRSSQK
ncbi:hypothetical protein TGAMA5MH_05024 [Trichoderma gamsii]|uniref:Uncharacterized protein n=1 Tax=Trichoderma gamsii TaxID=398673 RepID=A0A2K0TC43_9HYPO|nr:hypothetical protein TGAMA5MH_05024 [Trichoderma gamsii]